MSATVLVADDDTALELIIGKLREAHVYLAAGNIMARVAFTEAARAAAQLTVASPYEELMEAVPANGLSYLDIKEGGTTIELLGPFVHDVIYRGGPLEGMEEWIQAFPPLDD